MSDHAGHISPGGVGHLSVVAEFESPEALVGAYEALAQRGYSRLETWTPYALRELVDRRKRSPIPWWMMAGALAGGGLGYAVEWWCNAVSFPIDIGGRPLNPVPAFIPITFESAVLASCVLGFFALLAACGLPRLHHPVFEIDGFDRASVDRFWLGVDATDPAFDDAVAQDLERMGARRCERVERFG